MHPEDQIMLDDPRCEKILATGQLIKRRIISFSAFIIFFICHIAVALVADQRQSALDRVSAHSANLSPPSMKRSGASWIASPEPWK
jgi:hypothetical protein